MIQLFLLALLGSILALVGGVVFLFSKRLSHILESYSIPFAAGVLITVSLIGLIPESMELIGEQTLLVVLITFFIAYLFEHFAFGIHHHEDHDHHSYKSSVPLVLVGDTIHNFIDGIAIGASFLVNPGLGLITAVSTFMHEIPHEIGDFGILLKAGWKKKNILVANILSATLTIPGAFFVYFMPQNDNFVGVALGVAAGIFLYLGMIDFLPDVVKYRKGGKLKAVVALGLGVVVMFITINAIPHTNEHEENHDGEVSER